MSIWIGLLYFARKERCVTKFIHFLFILKSEFTEPSGSSIHFPENRLVDMFTSGTHSDVKDKILKSFKSPMLSQQLLLGWE